MIKINVYCIGKIKEKYLKDAILEYSKRISKFANLNIIELAETKEVSNASQKDISGIKDKESNLILSQIQNGYTICLTPDGKKLNSEEFADIFRKVPITNSTINFVIGGSYGLSKSILDISNLNLSFSDLTFPHQLFRVILLEQIFRGFKIINNENYHK